MANTQALQIESQKCLSYSFWSGVIILDDADVEEPVSWLSAMQDAANPTTHQ